MTDPLLDAVDLVKTFPGGVRAVDSVSLTVARGETVGLVGESGCGKSTTAKLLLRLLAPDSGTVRFDGADLAAARGRRLRELRRRLQVVPQNPGTSLNPRLTVRRSIEFNLRVHGFPRDGRRRLVSELMDRVGLAGRHADAFPHELSGGQLQRAAIARALATGPDLVVCDEAVSALDKSVQAHVLNLLAELQRDLGVAYLFISHDLSVVEHISDRVVVMYLGRVVEEGDASDIWGAPAHPYTRTLLSAAPGEGRQRIRLQGDPPNPAAPPPGCSFHTRCPDAFDRCGTERPTLLTVGRAHNAACWATATPTRTRTQPQTAAAAADRKAVTAP
ncbi:ABC transporter ATP-binding protein [Streptomyces sp. NPDC050560]|uniref:ABC transporter ATP-binding protein n=1 Tax=Streptomyces sp. NPDC050560 TaxID=3365630 RepID=UPI0037B75561